MTSTVAQTDRNFITAAIEKLRNCTQVDVQHSWHCAQTELDAHTGKLADINAKGHIAWSAGQILWLSQKFVIPEDLSGYPLTEMSLRLALTWWAEIAEIYVNGQLVQAGDLFDCSARVLLSSSVTPQAEIAVIIKLISPSHDAGALVKSRLVYESTDIDPEPGFIADEFAVLHEFLQFEPEKIPLLADALTQIDWSALPDKYKFMRSLLQVRNSVQHLAGDIKQRQIQLVGHAHLDLAWLWEISETWSAAQRTFTSVLNLQQDFPQLTFCHSTPALYAWIEEHRPDLFAAIQQQVISGRWEIIGGLWVEPELNLISGESIVRQLLYGQRYVLEKFGKISTVAWLPDSFGFCATLPQFLAQAGIEYFVTQKLLWNDTTQFPYKVFWWQSPDGTEIFSLMSAAIGEGVDPTKMAAYAYDWEQQTNLKTSLWLPGVGDHGGGPTRDMLETAQRWQTSSFFPQLRFTTIENYLWEIREILGTGKAVPCPYTFHADASHIDTLHADASHIDTLPTWDDELYLEFHRGCYTTHADQKRHNRRCEGLLYQSELFATLAITANTPYPKTELETAWKQVLFNQFHDILPGSSIPEVYAEVNPAWEQVQQTATRILHESLAAIASQIHLPSPPHPQAQPFVVFNSLNWQRSEVITLTLPDNRQYTIYDCEGNQLPTQQNASTLLFQAADVPGVGYRVFWLSPQNGNNNPNSTKTIPSSHHYFDDKKTFTTQDWILENEFLRVVVDAQTGDLSNIFDKTCGCEILNSKGGNQLQAFRDRGQYWDAWNIDPNYAEHPLPPTQLQSTEWIEQGVIQSRLRVVRKLGNSTFEQDYILQIGSPLLKIATNVDWQEEHTLVKAAFEFNIEAAVATYEIACGAIERTTKPQTPVEKAKWEVPALQWADLSTRDRGVSLLNDCKYGYDSQPHQLRLTLLRGAKWPDPNADHGWHQFTYAIYPHQGNWQQAQTVRRGYELNLPLQVTFVSTQTQAQLPAVGCFINLSAENLILMAFKPSEDDPQQWILRCYECHGEPAQLSLYSDLGLEISHPVDLLERETPQTNIQPWKIVSYAIKKR